MKSRRSLEVVAPALMCLALAAPAHAEPMAKGFGHDIQLSFALRGILPKGYVAHFDAGSSPSAVVSWQGGRPWTEVLDTTLASVNMHAEVSGSVVHVEPGLSSPAASSGHAALLARPGLNIASSSDADQQQTDQMRESRALLARIREQPAAPASTIVAQAPLSEPQVPMAPMTQPAMAPVVQTMPETVAEEAPKPLPVVKPGRMAKHPAPPPIPVMPASVDEVMPLTDVLASAPGHDAEATRAGGWHIQAGQTLFQVLSLWSKQSGWAPPFYDSPQIYPMNVTLTLQGKFEDVVNKLVYSVHGEPRPQVCLHTLSKIIEIKDDEQISASITQFCEKAQ